jgi:hypothetical protein
VLFISLLTDGCEFKTLSPDGLVRVVNVHQSASGSGVLVEYLSPRRSKVGGEPSIRR